MWRIPPAVIASQDDSVLLHHILDQLSDPQGFLKQVQELYQSNEKSFDTLYFKDGRIFERLSYALMEGMTVRGRVWSFHDITARKQAEEALTSSEAELRALFASMHDVVVVIDRAGVYRMIAPTNPELLVKPTEELLGKTLRDVFPSEQAETFTKVVQQVLDSKQTAQIEYDLIIGERTVQFETSISPMTADRTLWVARDITERNRAETALTEERHLLRTLLDNLPDHIYFKDRHSRFTHLSESQAQRFGLNDPADALGKTDFDFFTE
jgi:PAS domain S-box-containing protein